MKKMITILASLFMLSLLLFACSNNTQSKENTTQEQTNSPPPPPQNHVENIFSLEQFPEDFWAALLSEEIEQVRSDEFDGRFTELEGAYFTYRTYDNEITAAFTSDNRSVLINVRTPRYATERGIRVGDSEERLFELYGDDWRRGEHNSSWLYRVEENVGIGFHFGIIDGFWGIVAWGIFEPTLQAERTEAVLAHRAG